MTWDWRKAIAARHARAAGASEPGWGNGSAAAGAAGLDAEIRAALSWRRAVAGTAGLAGGGPVPLPQIEEHACAFCRGKGRLPGRGPCLTCHGTGKVRARPPAVRCALCRGRGHVPHNTRLACTVCKGKGVVAVRGPSASCPACRGRGRKPGQTLSCSHCGGTGVVTLHDPPAHVAGYLL